MTRHSNTRHQPAQSTSRALKENKGREVIASKSASLARKFKKPMEKTSTSDSDENQATGRQTKRKNNNPRKNEGRVETTTSKQTYQTSHSPSSMSPLIPSINTNTNVMEQNFDLEVIRKCHDDIHVAAMKKAEQEMDAEIAMPINSDTSCGTSMTSIEVSSNGTRASIQREQILSATRQIDHGNVENVEKQTHQPEVPIEAEDPRYRVICVDDIELEVQRKRTISVEDCEIDNELTQSWTRVTNAQEQTEIETVDLSIADEQEKEDENNVVHENVLANSLMPATATAGQEPHQIDENETSLVRWTKIPNNSLRRHKYKKTPRRMYAVEEIKRLQASVNLLIPKLPFQRLVREIMMDQFSDDFHIQGNALAALHEAAEMQLIEFFEDTALLCTHRDRATIALKDVNLACKLQERYALNHRSN